MNSENREGFSEIGFRRAQENLSTKEGLLKMQALANQIVGTTIGLTYSKLPSLEYKICFVLPPAKGPEIRQRKISELFMAIAQEFLYSNIMIIEYGSFSKPDFDTRYVEPVEISPDNVAAVQDLLRRHRLHLGISDSHEKKEENYGGTLFAEKPVVRKGHQNLPVKNSSFDAEEKPSEAKRSKHSSADDLNPASSGETISPPKKK